MTDSFRNPRFAFIEAMIVVYGELRRFDIMSVFGIQCATATRVLRDYRNKYPYNIKHDPVKRRYVASEDFITPNIDEFHADAAELINAFNMVAVKTIIKS